MFEIIDGEMWQWSLDDERQLLGKGWFLMKPKSYYFLRLFRVVESKIPMVNYKGERVPNPTTEIYFFHDYTLIEKFIKGEFDYSEEYKDFVFAKMHEKDLEKPCSRCDGTGQAFDKWGYDESIITGYMADPFGTDAPIPIYKQIRFTKPCPHCRGFCDNSYWDYTPFSYSKEYPKLGMYEAFVKRFSFKALIRLYACFEFDLKHRSYNEFEMFKYEYRVQEVIEQRLKKEFGMNDVSIWHQAHNIWFKVYGNEWFAGKEKPVEYVPRQAIKPKLPQ